MCNLRSYNKTYKPQNNKRKEMINKMEFNEIKKFNRKTNKTNSWFLWKDKIDISGKNGQEKKKREDTNKWHHTWKRIM